MTALVLVSNQKNTRGLTMSHTKRVNKLTNALRTTYAGPKAAHRLAYDTGWCLAAAKMALRGDYPRAWERFLRLIEKQGPAFLAKALETTWTDELQARHDIGVTRRTIESIERRLNEKAKTADSKGPE